MRTTILSLLLIIGFNNAFSQDKGLYYLDNRGRDALLAPRVGIGGGVFTFFGDVNDNNYQHVLTSTYGVEVRGSANLSRYFDLDLTAVYGNITINERGKEIDGFTETRNLNFKSEMFIGTVGLSYNFNHLYKKPGIIQPFIGFGVSFINFDSKSDQIDANGNRYYYDDQGAILTGADGNPTQRDYVFETDLRDENLDGLGKYDQFTFSLPVSAGIDFKMGKRVSAKLGVSFHYTFTDLIDNISDQGEGIRKGNSQNDMFLFTSASISYSIGVKRKYTNSTNTDYLEDVDFYALQIADSDEDGVNDFDDLCAQTPEGVTVDENGCPLDSDQDVIADYRDKEDSTKVNAVVDTEGITLTDERMLSEYADSLALKRSDMKKIYPSGVLNKQKVLTAEDSTKLAIMMLDIQSGMNERTQVDDLLDEVSKELSSQTAEQAKSVDFVYTQVDKIYRQMRKDEAISEINEIPISKEARSTSVIPPEFSEVDLNRDDIITAEEVMMTIDNLLEGKSTLTITQIYNLIDYYNEYMEDARIVNFGGTLAIYIDGKLNILEASGDDATNNKRFLAFKYPSVDLNGDGILSADEVTAMINKYQSGNSRYTKGQVNEVIDQFFEE